MTEPDRLLPADAVKRAVAIGDSMVIHAMIVDAENEGAILDPERLAAESLRKAERYRENRDRYITSNPDILGGTPVIAGTRISVYSVLGRLQDGDTAEDIMKDYPEISEQAIETAELYAKAHPLRGRPSGRPWLALS